MTEADREAERYAERTSRTAAAVRARLERRGRFVRVSMRGYGGRSH